MGILDNLEKKVEGTIVGVFSKFGSKELQPVDLSSALEREIDKQAVELSRERTVAPNEYRFEFSTPDFDRIESWGSENLANELADNLTKYAEDQRYIFPGPVVVIFEENLELAKGDLRLTSESVAGNAAPVTVQSSTSNAPILEINGKKYMLTADKTTLGRGSNCDIVIDDAGISRNHLEILNTPKGVVVHDLGSTNGTFVEGHQVPAATLVNGNTITIGRTRILFWSNENTQ